MQNSEISLKSQFYDKLYNEIIKETQDVSDVSLCLISNKPLVDNNITLECSHSFNYDDLFNEIYHQKRDYVRTETQRLKFNEIKCPYCRNVQKGLLPYIDGYKKVRFVNNPDRHVMKLNNCGYIMKSGKRKGELCNKKCTFKYCGGCKKKVDKYGNGTGVNTKSSGVKTCDAIIKSGKRVGQLCGRTTKECGKCGIHQKS